MDVGVKIGGEYDGGVMWVKEGWVNGGMCGGLVKESECGKFEGEVKEG